MAGCSEVYGDRACDKIEDGKMLNANLSVHEER